MIFQAILPSRMLRPLTAIDLTGGSLTHVGESLYRSDCPACGDALMVDRYSMVCKNATCSPGAFSPLSYMASFWGAEHLCDARVTANDRMRHAVVSLSDALEASRDHSILKLWAELSRDNRSDKPTVCDGLLRVRSALLDPLILLLGHIPSQIGALPETIDVELLQTSPHEVAGIRLRHRNKSKCIYSTSCRYTMVGLRRSVPGEPLVISSSGAVRIREDTQATVRDIDWRPGGCVPKILVGSPEELSETSRFLRSYANLSERAVGATIEGAASGSDRDVSWRDFSFTAFYYITGKASELSATAAKHIQNAALPGSTMRRLIKAARMQHRPHVARELSRLYENRVLYQDAKVTIKESSHAYVSESRGGVSDLTNFTLRPIRSVVFRDLGEVRYEVKANYGNTDRIVLITDECWEYPQKLQDTLRLQLLQNSAQSSTAVPSILDMHATKKWVLPELRRDSANLPAVDGLSFLGWSIDRRAFQAPGCRVTMEGVEFDRFPLHPSSPILRSYTSAENEWSEAMPPGLPQPVIALIGQMAANLVRQYLRAKTITIPVKQSAAARAWLSQIFRGIGQTAVYEFSSNAREATPNQYVRGMPLLASGLTRHQVEQTKSCCVCFCDDGAELPDYDTPDDLSAAARALQFILRQTVEWCLATSAEPFREAQSICPLKALRDEGAFILSQVCGVIAEAEKSDEHMRAIERILSQIPKQDTEVRMRVKGDRLRLNLRGLTIDDESKFRAAVEARYVNFDLQPHYLEVSASDMVPSLESYYGAVPEMDYDIA